MRIAHTSAALVGAVVVCLLAGGEPARGAVPEAAKRLKERSIKYIRDAEDPGAKKADLGRKASNSLKVAKMILDKRPRPHADDVRSELEDVAALSHWVRRKLLSKPRGASAGTATDAAALLRRAKAYARANPDSELIIAARYFQITDGYAGTPSADKARAALGGKTRPDPVDTDPVERPKRSSGSTALVDGFSKALANPGLSMRQKLASCERILRNMNETDPLRREVEAVRAILASDARSRPTALAAYNRAHAGGRLARQVAALFGAGGGGPSFDDLLTEIADMQADAPKAKACREFLRRGAASPHAAEVGAMLGIYAAKYKDDRVTAYLEYAKHYPGGTLKDQALEALRRSESRLIRELKSTLASGDVEEFRGAVEVHKELFPRSQVRREVRSMLKVLEEPPEKRIRAAERHARSFRKGYLTDAAKDLVSKWRAEDASRDLADLQRDYATAASRKDRADVCAKFLRAHPRHEAAAEAKAGQLMCSLATAKSRLEAVRKYLKDYPKGRFIAAAQVFENEYAVEMDDELYRAAKLRLDDPKTPYTARLSACNSYLEAMPRGKHAAAIRRAAEGVEELVERERAAYDKLVGELETIGSLVEAIGRCTEFLNTFPGGPHAGDVVSRQGILRRRQAEQRESDAYDDLTDRLKAFESKGRTNIAKAEECLAFIRQYPQGAHRSRVIRNLKGFAATSLGPHSGKVRACAFSRDSKHLVTCDADAGVTGSGIWIWELPEGKLRKIWEPRPRLTATSISAAGDDTMLLGERSGGLSSWQFLDGVVRRRDLLGRAPLAAVSTESESDGVLTCLAGAAKARLWRSPELHPDGQYTCGAGLSAAALDEEGNLVAVAGAGGRITVHATTEDEQLWAIVDAHGGAIDCVAFSPAGSLLASTSSRDGTVKVWASRTGELMWEVEEESTHLAFVGDDMLATGPSLRSSKDGDVLHELGGRGPVAASPDGDFLVTGHEDEVAKLWYLPALSVR